MTNVSIAIQHHPLRAELVAELRASVPGAELVVDPEPDAFRSPWRTYRHALELTPDSATHRLVLQDDVIVCGGFEKAVGAAAAAQPDRLICFFVGGSRARYTQTMRSAAARGDPFTEISAAVYVPAVATMWPVGLIAPLLAFVDAQRWPPAFVADDEIIGRFARHAGVNPIASVPSLVDHPDDVPSIVRQNRRRRQQEPVRHVNRSRVAACWIGECDPAGIDWAAW